jgi:hypothetical protein
MGKNKGGEGKGESKGKTPEQMNAERRAAKQKQKHGRGQGKAPLDTGFSFDPRVALKAERDRVEQVRQANLEMFNTIVEQYSDALYIHQDNRPAAKDMDIDEMEGFARLWSKDVLHPLEEMRPFVKQAVLNRLHWLRNTKPKAKEAA